MLEKEDQYKKLSKETLKEEIQEIEELEKDLERFQELLKYQKCINYGF